MKTAAAPRWVETQVTRALGPNGPGGIVAAREAGFEYHARCPVPRLLDGKALDGGLMVLSRYPITASDWHLYSASAHEDQLAAKGALYVKLEVGTRAVHLFDTHMQAFYNLDDRPATAAKSIQVEELAKFVLEKTSGDTEPVVMAGDFNINSHLAGAGDGSGGGSKSNLHGHAPTPSLRYSKGKAEVWLLR